MCVNIGSPVNLKINIINNLNCIMVLQKKNLIYAHNKCKTEKYRKWQPNIYTIICGNHAATKQALRALLSVKILSEQSVYTELSPEVLFQCRHVLSSLYLHRSPVLCLDWVKPPEGQSWSPISFRLSGPILYIIFWPLCLRFLCGLVK